MRQLINKINTIEKILKKRLEKSPLENYNSSSVIHKKQLEFHKCKKRNRWVFGGNRTGKTECGAVECVWLARGIHPYKKNKPNVSGWIVSVTYQTQRDVAQDKILHYIKEEWIEEIVMLEGRKSSAKNGFIDYILIKNIFGGLSKLAFKSQEQGREKFQGTSLDFVWFDEEPSYDIYIECRMRVMDKRGEIFGTMTPLKGLTWLYNEIYINEKNDDEVWCIFMEWGDNPFLSEEEIAMLTCSMSEEELQARKYGKFMINGGQVYSEFDENVNVIEPFDVPIEWHDNISIDPGLNNPLSAHWYAVDFDDNIYVIAEHYQARQSIAYHAQKIKEICKKLNWHTGYNGMFTALIDSASNQRTLASEKNVTELFYENGILVNPKVNKDLYSGINIVKTYLKDADGKSKLFIFKTCVNLIREIKSYFWGKSDLPIKKDDHALDELRYYVMYKQKQNKIPKKTIIQKNKQHLLNKIKRQKYL